MQRNTTYNFQSPVLIHSHMTLVTGGCRSGKSAFAVRLAESLPAQKIFVATCPVIDEEMEQRIARHRADREGRGWKTVEAPLLLSEAIEATEEDTTVLVDCLTLWVNNLLFEAEKKGEIFSEDNMRSRCAALLDVCAKRRGAVIFVTNEVGMGIVPADSICRVYRDSAGRCNQETAVVCGDVILMVAGLPLYLRKGGVSYDIAHRND